MEEPISAEEKILLLDIYPKILDKIKKNDLQHFQVSNFLLKSSELWEELIKNQSITSLNLETEAEECKKIKKFIGTHFNLVGFSLTLLEKDYFLIDDKFMNLTQLKILKLNNCRLMKTEVVNLNKFLVKNQVIEELELYYNSLKDNVEFLCEGIEKSQSLTSLTIKRNKIRSIEVLFNALANNDSITLLNLSGNRIIGPFLPYLNKMKKLKSLNIDFITDIDNNQENKCKYLSSLFQNLNTQTLSSLSVVGASVPDDILANLLNHLCNSKIISLFIEHNTLKNESIKAISHLLKSLKTLNILMLGPTNLTLKDIQFLSQNLEQNISLETLKFNYCSSKTYWGCFEVKKNRKLKTLIMKNCKIMSSDISFLIDSTFKSITSLDLSNNKLENDGLIYLSRYLQKNKSLKSLKLKNNNLSDNGVECLCEALTQNFTLKKLNLCQNQITNEGIIQFQKLYEKNTSITSLNLSENEFDCECIEYLVQIFQKIQAIYLNSNSNKITFKEYEIIKFNIFYNLDMRKCFLENDSFDHNPYFYDIRFILLRNKSFVKVPKKIHHFQDTRFSFNLNTRSFITLDFEKVEKKRKLF